jgi:hypothetical protein
VCDAPRIPTTYLDEAVLDGVQKRIERILDPERLEQELRGLLELSSDVIDPIHDLNTRLTETRVQITRLVQALAAGT